MIKLGYVALGQDPPRRVRGERRRERGRHGHRVRSRRGPGIVVGGRTAGEHQGQTCQPAPAHNYSDAPRPERLPDGLKQAKVPTLTLTLDR